MRYAPEIKPEHLFTGWFIFLPLFLFQTSLSVRIFQTVCVIALFILRGKRFKILPNILLFTGITAAHLLRPAGEVLLTVFGMPITKDALVSGVSRSLLLIGLVYVSRISISSRLLLPGRGGQLLGSVFFYFERITEIRYGNIWEKKGRVSLINAFTKYLDDILFLSDNLSEERTLSVRQNRYPGNKRYWMFMIPFLMFNGTLLILNYLKYL